MQPWCACWRQGVAKAESETTGPVLKEQPIEQRMHYVSCHWGWNKKNTLTTVFPLSLLLLFINLWSSLHIINIWWKCCFPGTSGSTTWRRLTPTWRSCWLSAAGTWHLLPSPRWWPLQSHQDFADHSVTFLKSNSFEARNIILIVH